MPVHFELETSDGRPRFAVEKANHTKKTIYSPNWCDKTTWYQSATRVVDEIAGDSGDHLTYELDHAYVIDTYHGKMPQEDFLVDSGSNSYRVVVKVNDVTKTEQDPHYGSGGDYTVDYDAGEVTFLSALDGADVVKVTYHYANGSSFTIAPADSTCLVVDVVEVQFTSDLVINDTMIYQLYGDVDVFAPQLTPDPYDSGTKIPLGNPLVFKTMDDYFADSNGSYVKYPQNLGGTGWRGNPADMYLLRWDYVRSTELHYAYGMELRMSLEHDTVMTGSSVVATFYGASVSHPDD